MLISLKFQFCNIQNQRKLKETEEGKEMLINKTIINIKHN